MVIALESDDGNDYRISAGLKYIGLGKSPARRPLKAVTMKDHCRIFNGHNKVTVRFHSNDFGFDQNNAPLTEVGQLLAKHQERLKAIIIEGHTSRAGSEQYNLWLSKNRANYAAKYFSSFGTKKELFKTRGLGELSPLDQADNGNEKEKKMKDKVLIFYSRTKK